MLEKIRQWLAQYYQQQQAPPPDQGVDAARPWDSPIFQQAPRPRPRPSPMATPAAGRSVLDPEVIDADLRRQREVGKNIIPERMWNR